MKKQKKILLITVLGVIALIGVVYAAFTVLTLKINTTATASASIFSVSFDDVAPVTEKSNDNITVTATTPTERDTDITLSVSGLKAPGDEATINYFIINDGDIDASDIAPRLGPALAEGEDWPKEFSSPGSTWVSDDGVFQFSAYSSFGGDYSGEEYWKLSEGGASALPVGIKGVIRVYVKLLKRVDAESSASCTMKLIAMPDGASIGNVE